MKHLRWTVLVFLYAFAASSETVPPSAPAEAGKPGAILCEFFQGIGGDRVADLVKESAFPTRSTYGELLKSFEFTSDEQNYGSVVRGYVTAPQTGNYVFFIAADDAGELYLSSDEKPAHKKKICECPQWCNPKEWGKFPTQKSGPVALVKDRRYYIEALHKQGDGPSHLAVGWQLPDGTKELPIAGSHLSPAGMARPMPPPEAMKVSVTFKSDTKVATTPGVHKFPLDVTVERNGQRWQMSYLLILPKDYDPKGPACPVFVFLCGNSHQGSDLEGILNEGPANFLTNDPKLMQKWPFIGLFPQPPGDMRWDSPGMAEAVVGIVDGVVARYRADPDRVYVTGLSMGGKGTWLVAEAAPDRFAAVAPICAVSVKPAYAQEALKYVPTWIICGSDDGEFTNGSKEMGEVLKSAGAPSRLTVVPHEGHGVWARFYSDVRFYDWLLTNKRTAAQTTKSAAATKPVR